MSVWRLYVYHCLDPGLIQNIGAYFLKFSQDLYTLGHNRYRLPKFILKNQSRFWPKIFYFSKLVLFIFLKPCCECLYVAGTQGHMNAIFDLSWSDSCLRLASVSGDHTAMLWDVSDRDITPIGMCEGHTRSVKVASFRPQSTSEYLYCSLVFFSQESWFFYI